MRENNLEKKITLEKFLTALSLIVVSILLLLYILGKVCNIDSINRIFNSSETVIFVWLVGFFVILANLGYIRNEVRTAVKEHMDSLVITDVREKLKEEFSNDPEMLNKLQEAQDRKYDKKLLPKPPNLKGPNHE